MKILYSTLLCLLCIAFFDQGFATDKMGYWSVQRKGANFFNQTPSPDWFKAASEIGIGFARLAPDKWKCEQLDFLLGDADQFT
jgi:hypothetical protein